jgi:leader peptidase (prepilin peptidase)/N-methyltransferase
MPAQLAALVVSLALAWPLSVLAWSLPDGWFDMGALKRTPRKLVVLSLLLPVLCAVWAAATVPAFVLPALLPLGWTLIVLAIVDARTLVLPDCLTLPLIALGVCYTAWINAIPGAGTSDHAVEAIYSLVAAAVGFLSMALVAKIYRTIRGIEGLGLGDAKLLAAAGAWVGLAALPTVVLLAAAGALLITAISRRLSRPRDPTGSTPVPFGPYLAGGTWIVALYGPLSFT